MTRIEGSSITSTLNPFSHQTRDTQQAAKAPTVGSQVQQVLFGKAKPPLLDPALFPQLAEQLQLLRKYKKKLATMAGDSDDEYSLYLADGTIAMIDAEGRIFVGAEFLATCTNLPEVLVGVLAHEIGHRPKRWKQYKSQRQLSQQELHRLCRHEETRADIFAGKALAEMELDCQPLITFLLQLEQGPHPDYFPAETRGEIIRESHQNRRYRTNARKNLFPDYHRLTSPKGHLGDY
jgi:hypothetical protein